MKLPGLLLIRCIFTKKTEGAKKGQKFVKIGTGKNIGFPEQCALYKFKKKKNIVAAIIIRGITVAKLSQLQN